MGIGGEREARPLRDVVAGVLIALSLGGCWLSGPIGGEGDGGDPYDSEGLTDTDSDGDTDTFPPLEDPDGDTDSETDDSGGGGGGLYDPVSGLIWEQPPEGGRGLWYDAFDYCDQLVHAGLDDWRLPRIEELISLLRGCGSVSCQVSDPQCLELDCAAGPDCEPCATLAGPDDDGCYWDPQLSGLCDRYWSISVTSGTQSWFVRFTDGQVSVLEQGYNASVRCVRDPG